MKKTFVGLDLLRFGLALYLMVFHTVHFYPEVAVMRFHQLLSLGSAATSSFFLLSGFILAHVYFGNGASTIRGGARDFLIKRLTNLYPIHLISLVLFLAVTSSGGANLTHYMLQSLVPLPNAIVTLGPVEVWFNRVLTLLLLDTWNPLYVSLNPPAWSLSVLMFFYFCFPWMAPRLLSSQRKFGLLLLIWLVYLIPPAVACVMHWYGPPADGIVTSNPIVRLPEFMAGIVFYGMYRGGMLRPFTEMKGWKLYALAFVAVNFVVAAWLMEEGALWWQYMLHNGGLMPAELLLLLVFADSFEASSPRLSRVAARVGNAALSIFAIHLALFYLFVKVQKLFSTGMSPVACLQHPRACIAAYHAASTPSLLSYPLYLIAVVLIAVYFQEIVVVKVRDALRRRLLSSRATERTSSAAQTKSDVPDLVSFNKRIN